MVLPFRLAVDESDLPQRPGRPARRAGLISARDRGGTSIGRVADVWHPPGPHCKTVAAIRDVQPERARRPRRDVFKGKHQAEGKIMRIFVAGATGALGRHLVPAWYRPLLPSIAT